MDDSQTPRLNSHRNPRSTLFRRLAFCLLLTGLSSLVVACGAEPGGASGESPAGSSKSKDDKQRSPSQLVEELNHALEQSPPDIGFWLRQVQTQDPQQAKAIRSTAAFYTAALSLNHELETRFGQRLPAEMVPEFPAGAARLTGDKAIEMEHSGKTERISIVEVDGRWYMSPDALGASLGDDAEQMDGLVSMMADMASIFERVDGRLRDGSYANYSEAEKALQNELTALVTSGGR